MGSDDDDATDDGVTSPSLDDVSTEIAMAVLATLSVLYVRVLTVVVLMLVLLVLPVVLPWRYRC